jgi:hypothetical protein
MLEIRVVLCKLQKLLELANFFQAVQLIRDLCTCRSKRTDAWLSYSINTWICQRSSEKRGLRQAGRRQGFNESADLEAHMLNLV